MTEPQVEAGDRVLETARKPIDWQQVVLNGGPPCFHIEDGKFCLRAERWDGHSVLPDGWYMHRYVPLAALIQSAMNAQEREWREALRRSMTVISVETERLLELCDD